MLTNAKYKMATWRPYWMTDRDQNFFYSGISGEVSSMNWRVCSFALPSIRQVPVDTNLPLSNLYLISCRLTFHFRQGIIPLRKQYILNRKYSHQAGFISNWFWAIPDFNDLKISLFCNIVTGNFELDDSKLHHDSKLPQRHSLHWS
jgi:hypothetical protein